MAKVRVFLIVLFSLFAAVTTHAQLPNATDITATPSAGDHDYLHSQIETVNPANGSLSVRIPVSVPTGRQLTPAVSIAYDSNGAFYMLAQGSGPAYHGQTLAIGTQGGWSFTYPLISFNAATFTIPGSLDHLITCHGTYNYVFQGS